MKRITLFAFALTFMAGTTFAQSNEASITQYGTNIGQVVQTGLMNKGTIEQGASGAAVTNSGSNAATDWKYGAFIDQLGGRNEAIIDMNSGGNGASVYQSGVDNYGFQFISASHVKTTNLDEMGVDLDQIGSNNWSQQQAIKYAGVAGIKGLDVYQEGDYNRADQYSKGGYTGTMTIRQVGSNNNNPVESGNSFDVTTATGIDPLGLGWAQKPAGDFTQYQAWNGTATMDILGDDNNAAQYQEFGTYSYGGKNLAYLNISGDGNNVGQGQLGNDNSSDVDLTLSSFNVIATLQQGNTNTAVIGISVGDSNVVGLSQIGNGHVSTVVIAGASNVTKIIQQ